MSETSILIALDCTTMINIREVTSSSRFHKRDMGRSDGLPQVIAVLDSVFRHLLSGLRCEWISRIIALIRQLGMTKWYGHARFATGWKDMLVDRV